MNTITRFAFPFALFSAVAMLTGCIGAEDEPEPEAAAVEMSPWNSAPRPEIARVLSEHPGGLQISEVQIAWDEVIRHSLTTNRDVTLQIEQGPHRGHRCDGSKGLS